MCKFSGKLKGLKRQVSSRRENQSPNTALGDVLLQTLKHGEQKRRRFAGTSAGHGDDVVSGEDEGHGFALDGSGDLVALALDCFEDIGAQVERLEPSGLGFLLLQLAAFQIADRAHVLGRRHHHRGGF